MKKTEMKAASNEELVKRFEVVALARSQAMTNNDPKSANKAFKEQAAILKELENRQPPAIPVLNVLLNSPDPWVRVSAGAPLLFFLPDQGQSALERIAREELGGPRTTASVALDQWREGKLKRWW